MTYLNFSITGIDKTNLIEVHNDLHIVQERLPHYIAKKSGGSQGRTFVRGANVYQRVVNIYRTLLFMRDASLGLWMNILERHQILSSLQFWCEPHRRLEKLAHLNGHNFDFFYLLLKKTRNVVTLLHYLHQLINYQY